MRALDPEELRLCGGDLGALPSPTLHGRAPANLVFLRVVSNGLQMAHEEFECFIVVSWEVPDLGGRERGM